MVENVTEFTSNIDSRGQINRQIAHARDKGRWEYIVRNKAQRDKGEFIDPKTNMENLHYRLILLYPRVTSDNVSKFYVTLGRTINATVNMKMRETMDIFRVEKNFSKREVKMKHIILARKYHPNKQSDYYAFEKWVGENIFKNIANEHQKIQ